MSTEFAAQAQATAAIMERVLHVGDLSKLTPQERADYYLSTCESLGLNPTTRPFEYIVLNGKMTLYPRRDCTDQLRKRDRVSISIVSRERMSDAYVVTARATTPDGRQDESIGAVPLTNLSGEALSNALMKAETKSKRRVTLSICGLGFVDESEVDSIPGAQRVQVNDQGEVIDIEPAVRPETPQPMGVPAPAQAPAQSAGSGQPAPTPRPTQPPSRPGETFADIGAESVVVTFGKHQGKCLGRIMIEDPGYIQYLAANAKGDALRAAAQQLAKGAGAQKPTAAQPATAKGPDDGACYINDEQRKRLYALVEECGLPNEAVREWLTARQIPSARHLTPQTYGELLIWLEEQHKAVAEIDIGETFGDGTDGPF